jgi:hypothetical protein
METIEQISSEGNEFKKLLEEIFRYNPEMLLRKDLAPNLNFEKGLHIFKNFLNLYHDLRLCDLDNIPFEELKKIKPLAKEVLDGINEIINFTPIKYPNPEQERDGIIERSIKNYSENHWPKISPIIAYSMRKGIDYESLERKAKESSKELKNLIEDTKSEVEETLEAIRKAAAEAGVSQYKTAFKDMAEEYGKKSIYWFLATILWAIAIVVSAALIFLYYSDPKNIPTTTAMAIHYSLPKLIIFSTLYFALVWSAKNYNANRHNYIVNKHRQNALQTFEAFIKAAESDPATKNAVILQTTQSIFSSQPSGYVHKDSESESPFKVLEFIRTVGGGGQK